MRFAFHNNSRIEATPGIRGTCPGCGQPLVAKCGSQRIHHWAHQSDGTCDGWWEPETPWHRAWKDNYPNHWQEIFLPDPQTGENHIADIRTEHGLVIEFQHSHLDPKECAAREQFYKHMVWVVDCSRLKRDFPRFMKGMKHFQYENDGVYRVQYPEECFPSAWLQRGVPVVFDFKNAASVEQLNDLKDRLYCLFPVRVGTFVTVVQIPRKAFINSTLNGEWTSRVGKFMDDLHRQKQEWDQQDALFRLKLKLEDLRYAAFLRNRRGRRL